jgi:hypothetical protein
MAKRSAWTLRRRTTRDWLEVGRETSVLSPNPPASAPDFSARRATNVPNHTAAQVAPLELPARTGGRRHELVFHAEKDHALWWKSFPIGSATDAALRRSRATRRARSSASVLNGRPAGSPRAGCAGPPLRAIPPAALCPMKWRPTASASPIVSAPRPRRRISNSRLARFRAVALPESPANDDKKFFVRSRRRGAAAAFFHLGVLRRGYDGPIAIRAELAAGRDGIGRTAAGATTGTLTFPRQRRESVVGFHQSVRRRGGVSRETEHAGTSAIARKSGSMRACAAWRSA